ncbi:oligopeptide transporter [Artemisia annua]|uniref:Oligopeptide transporter n=1 Tax=Artemisia annua TaxID=35608 RepID=A0A2U1LQK8_ARTAN|nr:oligopeptide transporter [Artemisia annua]
MGGFGSYLLSMDERTYNLIGADYPGNRAEDVKNPGLLWMMGFIFVVSFLGLFSLVPLRKVMVMDYKLTYPSGTATAMLINSFHTTTGAELARKQVSSLGKYLSISFVWSCFKWFFSGVGDACGFDNFPSFGLMLYKNTFYFDFSPTYVGCGLICPHIVNCSVLFGAIVSWGFLWPFISTYAGDWYPADLGSNDFKGLYGYKVFISIALILGDGLYNLVKIIFISLKALLNSRTKQQNLPVTHEILDAETTKLQLEEKKRDTIFLKDNIPTWVAASGYIALVGISMATMPLIFPPLKWYLVLCSYIIAPALAFCNSYGTGLTDWSLASTYGKIGLFIIASLVGSDGGVIAGLAACGVMMSIVSTAADLMQDFKTGYLTLSSAKSMFVSQLVGTAMGCVIAPLTFWMFWSAFEIGTPDSPYKAPYAVIYREMAILGVEGFSELPKHCLALCCGFFVAALVLNLLRDFTPKKVSQFIPIPMAMAVPFYIGAYFAIDMFIGTVILFVWERVNKKDAEDYAGAVASGLICGDGIWTIPSAILSILRVDPPICMYFGPSVEYVKSLEEIINKYCEESRKMHDSKDEWIRKFKETTDLNLKKLDARKMNVEAMFEKLNQTVLENKKNDVEEAKMGQIKEVNNEPVPRNLPIVKPCVPPIPFLGHLKVVRKEETSKDQAKKMETKNLKDEEAIPQTDVESNTTKNGMISYSYFITNNLASFPIQVDELINEEAQPLTSQTMLITPPKDGYFVSDTEPILIELEKESGGKVIYTTVSNKEANEAMKPIIQPQHGVFKSSYASVNPRKVSREMISPSRYACLSEERITNKGPQSILRIATKKHLRGMKAIKNDYDIDVMYDIAKVAGELQIFVSEHYIDISTVLIPDDGSLEESFACVISEETKLKCEERVGYLHQMYQTLGIQSSSNNYDMHVMFDISAAQGQLEIYIDHGGVDFIIAKYICPNATLAEMMDHVITEYTSDNEEGKKVIAQSDYTFDQMVEWAEQEHFENEEAKADERHKSIWKIFRSVSKSWKAAIDCNDFIRRYGFHEVDTSSFVLTYKLDNMGFMFYVDDNLGFTPINTDLMLTTLKPVATFEVPSYMDQPDSPKMVFGFGVHPDTLDPTLIKINYRYYGQGPWYVSVFTLSSGRWNILDNYRLPRQTIRLKRSGQACVGGKIYWPASERFINDDGMAYKIYMLVLFDLITHRFLVVNLPEELSILIPFPFKISQLGNSIVVLASYYVEEIRFLCAWLLEVDGGFTKDEEPMVEANISQQMRRSLQVFVLNAETFLNVGVEGDSGSFIIGPNKESLILSNFNHRELLVGFNI